MLGQLISYQIEHQTIHLRFAKGDAQIAILSPSVVHVYCQQSKRPQKSWAVEAMAFETVDIAVEKKGETLEISTPKLTIQVNSDLKVDFFDSEGEAICLDHRGPRTPLKRRGSRGEAAEEGLRVEADSETMAIEVLKVLGKDDAFYGLGEKTGHFNKRGMAYENWNTDNPEPHVESDKTMYKTIPFVVVNNPKTCYGLFFDNPYRSVFDLGKESEAYFYYGVAGGNLDYYFIAGPQMTDVVRRYTNLTGKTPLPQLWSLGYQQSRFSYHPGSRVKAVAEGFRAHEIPCDVLHLDIDYMDDFKVFTFDPVAFPNVGEMIGDLKAEGFKVVTIIDPGVKKQRGYQVYDEGIAQGHFATDEDGIVYVNRVWPGDSVFPDFSRSKTRKWWAGHHGDLVRLGVAGIWNDMNEPASFNGPLPDHIRFENDGQPTDHREIHNVYGHLMCQATYDGLKTQDGKRPFVITRAAYAGTQKYACVWTGDNQSFWDHLRMAIPMLLNLGLSGIAFAGTDVGGFSADTTPELLARWTQIGCFSPLFRNHSCVHTRDQEPWALGEETLKINKKYIELRYQLLPYLYDCFWEGTQSGLPILRPLVLHYQDDPEVLEMNDQFLFGEQMLVAPVLHQGAKKRMVYLPKGRWFDYWTGQEHQGPKTFIQDAPLDFCPIYVKAGSLIPLFPIQQYVGELQIDALKLKWYPGEGAYSHYTDDGESFAYEQGQFDQFNFTTHLSDATACLDIEIETLAYGAYRSFEVLWQGEVPRSATFNGESLRFEQSTEGILIIIPAEAGQLLLTI